MSGSAGVTGTVGGQVVVSQTEYFSYTSSSKPAGIERTTQQIWSLDTFGPKITVYVQGNTPVGVTTFFSKKHLLVHYNNSNAASPAAKMAKIAGRRNFKAIKAAAPDGFKGAAETAQINKIKDKYSPTGANNGSTFILLDELDSDDFRQSLYDALTSASRHLDNSSRPGGVSADYYHSDVQLPGSAVRFCLDGTSTPTAAKDKGTNMAIADGDMVNVKIGFYKSGDVYVINHCGDTTKAAVAPTP